MYELSGMVSRSPSHRHGQAGFTLLEAIVAIALLGALLIPLYGLMTRNLDGLFRVGQANLQSEVMLNAIALLDTINPMERPEGSQQLGSYTLRWKSIPLTTPVDGTGFPAGQSLYQISMYRTEAEILRPGSRGQIEAWLTFDIRQIGWKQVRQFRLPF
jgi:general secretion pathway protein I